VIATVPAIYPGSGRKVYPGFLQLAGFMAMNLGDHLVSHWEMFKHLVEGDEESAETTRKFYDEYRSVADMTAEFYLQTVDVVFQRHLLPKGKMNHRGRKVDPKAITNTALLAIEGERDDISGIGQTKAALGLAANLPDSKKRYFMAEGAGHYGIFNGRKWREKIAPVVEEWIAKN
jgi:poly(3-hydroxybutyrate) depolymerase